LFALEAEARDAMNDIEKENAQLTKRAQENLLKKTAAIEESGAERIRRIVNETESHTAARIAQIQEEYRAKTAAFEKDFMAKREALRGKIFHDVLRG